MTPPSDLQTLIELAQRRVRTQEGARLYGKPIGSIIGEAEDGKKEEARPVTLERLKSLQAQFENAKRTGDTSAMKDIQEEFTLAVTEFRKTRQDPGLLRELVGASGNQASASKKP